MLVIKNTKGIAIKYGFTSFRSNVPIWLFSAYFNMIITFLFLQKISNVIFNTTIYKTI